MKILVVGGTRFMGKYLVQALVSNGHDVTIANRGITPDDFEDNVTRLIIDRLSAENMKEVLAAKTYDIVYDTIAYCSNDIKSLLDAVNCSKYIFISTTAVYDKHINTKEDEYNPSLKPLIWCDRNAFPYDEIKRLAECAVVQEYPQIDHTAVRFPFVIGSDDYTKRLYFYVDHILNNKPMFIDNYENQMAFVRSDEAGEFMAFLADNSCNGAVNGASDQTISIKEIMDYVILRTGKTPILSPNGEKAPYNGENEYSINTEKAKALGYSFTPLKSWIFELIDIYIAEVSNY